MKTAVIVIDVQRALCEGEYAAFESERVIARINEVTAKARAAGIPQPRVISETRAPDLQRSRISAPIGLKVREP